MDKQFHTDMEILSLLISLRVEAKYTICSSPVGFVPVVNLARRVIKFCGWLG